MYAYSYSTVVARDRLLATRRVAHRGGGDNGSIDEAKDLRY